MNIEVIQDKLNELYKSDESMYKNECNIFKNAGFRIFRNPQGEHRVLPPPKANNKYDAMGRRKDDMFKGTVFEQFFT